MRKIVVVIVVLLAVAFVVFGVAELQNIRIALGNAEFKYLLAAFLFEVICLFNAAGTFSALYRVVGLEEGFRRMFLMASAANFVNLIAPSAGVGGIAVFLDGARRHNDSSGRVMVVGILYLVYEYMALFCVLLAGFIVLIKRNSLNVWELVAAGFLLIVALAIGSLLVLGYRSSKQLGDLLAWLSRAANRLLRPVLHRDLLNVENAHGFSREVADGISAIRGSHDKLLWPLLFTLNNKLLLLCILTFSFLALNTPFTLGTLLAGFSISYLFFYASPSPSGVGMVEGIMPTALSTLGVPFTEAVLITLVFRAVTLWFPFVVGGLSFRWLQKQPKLPVSP